MKHKIFEYASIHIFQEILYNNRVLYSVGYIWIFVCLQKERWISSSYFSIIHLWSDYDVNFDPFHRTNWISNQTEFSSFVIRGAPVRKLHRNDHTVKRTCNHGGNLTMQCTDYLSLLTPLLDSSARKLFRAVSSAFSRCLFSVLGISQISEHNNHRIEAAEPIDTAEKTALAIFRSRETGHFLARTKKDPRREVTSIARGSKREREKERKRGTGLEGFSFPFSLSTCAPTTFHESAPRTYLASVRPIARELRKAMQARATRRALVPSYVLTSDSWLVLSTRPSLPGFSLSVYLVVSLLLLPSPPNVHIRSPSFALFPVASFSLWRRSSPSSSFRFSVTLSMRHNHPRSIFSDLLVRIRLSLLSITNLSTFSLHFFFKCFSISHDSSFGIFRSMSLRLLHFNLIRSFPTADYGRRIYHTWFSVGNWFLR